MANVFTTSLLFQFLLYLTLTSPAFSDHLPSTLTSTTQLQFWSENVINKMPLSISTKLSPLSQHESDHYAKAMFNNNFISNDKFCSLAKLACPSQNINVISAPVKIYSKYQNIKFVDEIPLEKVDPFTFFRTSVLKEKNTIRLSNLKVTLPFRSFLPTQIASRISLTPKGISKIFPKQSSIKAIDEALFYCSAAAIEGEEKTCPKSLEEMIGFSKRVLRQDKLIALASKSTRGSGRDLVIRKIKQFDAEKLVACHEMFLPFATYFCHSVPSSRIYSVDLVDPENVAGAPVNTVVAVCHMDTSGWPENHVAFKILKFGPGQGEVCHWLSEIDLAWIGGGGNV